MICKSSFKLRVPKKRKGQSTIEFALVLFAFIFFLSVSYNAVVSFVVYQYLSYATFMSARAYQAARQDEGEQLSAAEKTMAVYVPGVKPGPQNTRYAYSATRTLARITAFTTPTAGKVDQKFTLEFEVPFVTLPIGEGFRRDFGTIKLTATSLLGREPNASECRQFFREAFDRLRGNRPMNVQHNSEGMEDNGC